MGRYSHTMREVGEREVKESDVGEGCEGDVRSGRDMGEGVGEGGGDRDRRGGG